MVNDFLESLVSEATKKSYKKGLAKFEEYFGKEVKFLLKEKEPGKVIEKFYVWLRKRYSQNSCRALVNPIIQYCKYNNIEPRIRKALGIYRSTITTRDYVLQVSEAQEMYNVGSLEEKVMVKTWLLGLRIGDACRLKWQWFNLGEVTEEPKEVLIHTKKEGIVAHCFIDEEFQRLLKKHLPNLDQNNPYLFQSEKGGYLSERQLLRKLQSLQKRAHIDSRGKNFGWHIARKLFLRTCAENGISVWNAKQMIGKAIPRSDDTYVHNARLAVDAKKVLNVLKMEPSRSNGRVTNLQQAMDLVLKVLRKMIVKELTTEGYGEGMLGVIRDYSRLTYKEIMEEYLKES